MFTGREVVDERIGRSVAERQVESVYGLVPRLAQPPSQAPWELSVNEELHREQPRFASPD